MPGEVPIDDEARDDAVDVLKDLIEWELAPQRWERVDSIVGSLADALAQGDGDALREATAELELTGPVRVTRIGGTSLIPVPERTRDRANHLVHTLGQQPERQRQEERADASTDGPGGDGDGAGTSTD
ncbi:CATRA system-associated protein [Streptomyces apricus]|uniref:CATRA-Associated Small Protein domain-containing protein n=1 Tax=Streptomyces apricus TaxID=1828112 RepID=A0A5B0BFG5_9ACTN|nr:CATRA system-associated protein [Streptomyces apricus]KAA0940810.1 hypothetical protein FGF04_08070 [Streptomyces apricus]